MTRMLSKTVLVAAAAALPLSACATQNIYRPVGIDGARTGYAEQKIDADRYRVSFQGNSITSRERVEMGLLLRAAELTRDSGYDWFATVNRNTDVDSRLRIDRDPFGYSPFSNYGAYNPYWGPSWRYYRGGFWNDWAFGGRSLDVRQIDRFEATSEIVMGRGAKPSNDPNAFDAREVVQNLGPRFSTPAA